MKIFLRLANKMVICQFIVHRMKKVVNTEYQNSTDYLAIGSRGPQAPTFQIRAQLSLDPLTRYLPSKTKNLLNKWYRRPTLYGLFLYASPFFGVRISCLY